MPPTTSPPTLFGASDRSLAAGTYVVDRVEGAPTRPILITVGDGWSTFLDGWGIYKGEGQIMTFSRPDRVFVDACHPSDGDHPGPLTTLDGVVTALIEQRGWADVTTPADISIDGYTGKAFERTAPHSLSGCPGDFESWLGPTGTSVYPPGDTVTDWVLDLDGTIVVLETRVNAGQAAEAHTELATILDSIHIAQP